VQRVKGLPMAVRVELDATREVMMFPSRALGMPGSENWRRNSGQRGEKNPPAAPAAEGAARRRAKNGGPLDPTRRRPTIAADQRFYRTWGISVRRAPGSDRIHDTDGIMAGRRVARQPIKKYRRGRIISATSSLAGTLFWCAPAASSSVSSRWRP